MRTSATLTTAAALPMWIPSASDWRRRATGIGDIVTFLIPATLVVELQIGGRLFLPEVILLALLPFLLIMRPDVLRNRYLLTFIALALLWLFGQVLTDVMRNIPFGDYSRGWADVGFTLTNFVALFLLVYGNRPRLVFFALGMAAGLIAVYVIHPGDFSQGDPWKFGVGYPATILVILLAQWRPIARVRLLPTLLIWSLAFVSLHLGSRSLAGETFMAGAFCLMQRPFRRRNADKERPLLVKIAVTAGIVAAAAFMLWIYSYGAAHDWLGDQARTKFESESMASGGFILGGRPDVLVAYRAIADSPIIGHGSWAKDSRYLLFAMSLADYGYGVATFAGEDTGLINSHSCLLGAWVDAGILGVPFWLWVIYLSGMALLRLYRRHEPLTPLVAFFAFTSLWDALLSPFGAERRLFVPFAIVLFIFALESGRARQLLRRPRGAVQARAKEWLAYPTPR